MASRPATRADLTAVTETIGMAFHDDPTWSWAFPDPVLRQEQYGVFWRFMIAGAMRQAITSRHFRSGVDPEQFAFDLYGIMLVTHFSSRLLRDPKASGRASRAFSALLAAARLPASRKPKRFWTQGSCG